MTAKESTNKTKRMPKETTIGHNQSESVLIGLEEIRLHIENLLKWHYSRDCTHRLSSEHDRKRMAVYEFITATHPMDIKRTSNPVMPKVLNKYTISVRPMEKGTWRIEFDDHMILGLAGEEFKTKEKLESILHDIETIIGVDTTRAEQ